MKEKNSGFGVLNEQGYIMGQGLGFARIKESELKNEEDEKENKAKDKK